MTAVLSAIGRLCLVTIFLMSAVGNKIPNFSGTAAAMASAGVPFPEVALGGAIVFLVVGSLTVLAGWHGRIGAALLAVFLVLATYYFHAFWKVPEEQVQGQMIHAMKNLGLLGAMLFLIANGTGAGSLDKPKA